MQKNNNPYNKANSHAQLNVLLAILKANQLVELLTGFMSFFVLVKAVNTPNLTLKLLALMAFFAGLGIFYFAIKIRVDIYLFEHWYALDEGELDNALIHINANHVVGRSLEDRLDASYGLFKKSIFLLVLQVLMLLLLIVKS